MSKKTYVVSGPHPVAGHLPGEEFQAEFPPEQEQFLIEVGHLKVKGKEKDNGKAGR